jgi:5-methylcytosine-specific restriction endonuclease McrBC GTP-binding regulatory subunit McrB
MTMSVTGRYLTEAPPELVAALNDAYRRVSGQPLPYAGESEVASTVVDSFNPSALFADVFLPKGEIDRILRLLRLRKNVILQGPPGVGKSFVARRLAEALCQSNNPLRVAAVQFHQSYSYEDFVQGFRPVASGFELRDGIFFKFCDRARKDLDRPYVFLIDEINRGNLSKILGELMLLIEGDKRGPKWAVPLT